MASREDILPGNDEGTSQKLTEKTEVVKETVKGTAWETIVFGFLSVVFMVLSVGSNWATTHPVTWMVSYSQFWVLFTLPSLAIRYSPMNR